MRDEAYIIRSNVEYHLAQGIDHVVVTDNSSVHGTIDILVDLARSGLLMGKPYEQWEGELLSYACATPFFSFGLHDCYAGKWLGHYRDRLGRLAAIKPFATADEICDSMFLNGSLVVPPSDGDPSR